MASGNPILNGIATNSQKQTYQRPQQPGGQYGQQPQYGQQAQYGQQLSADQLNSMYQAPAAGAQDTDRATREDVVVKTLSMLGIIVVTGAVGWFLPALALVGAIAGFVLAMINIFKKKVSPGLAISYAAAEGLFLGGISSFYEARFGGGIVLMAVVATAMVFFGMLTLYSRAGLRIKGKVATILFIAMVSYAVFLLGSFAFSIFAHTDIRSMTIPGTSIPLGVVIGLLAVGMAALCLVSDFQHTEEVLQMGVPRRESWRLAFGLVVTLVWLYVEILRLISYFMPRD